MRILVAHPKLYSIGGGSSVAAWTLQALRDSAEVTLVSLEPPDFAGVNQMCGTWLREDDVEVVLAAEKQSARSSKLPFEGWLLRMMMLMRACRRLDRERRFDRLVCTSNEFDFGRPGIQYIHYPWAYLPRPATEQTWIHRIPGAVRSYQAIASRLAPVSARRVRANRTLVNSSFVRQRYRDAWGADARVVHPQVPGGFPNVPWEDRSDAFVCLGRLHREKRMIAVLEIVAELRRRGFPLDLHFIGTIDYPEYVAELRAQIEKHGDWAKVHVALSRAEMVELVARQRYGIHAMVEEHFGIAPAELQRAGCSTFAHRSGGPVEILGGDERVLFASQKEAVDKIEAVLRSEARQRDIRRDVALRSPRFSEELFIKEIRREVLGVE